MQGNIEAGDDPTVIESESEDGVSASLWAKKGRRLYLNGYKDRYVDLNEGTVEGGYTGGLSVEVDDGTLTVSGRGTTVVVDLDLDTEDGDGAETEDTDTEDELKAETPDCTCDDPTVTLRHPDGGYCQCGGWVSFLDGTDASAPPDEPIVAQPGRAGAYDGS